MKITCFSTFRKKFSKTYNMEISIYFHKHRMNVLNKIVKFIYSEKATKFSEIFPLILCTAVESKGKISQNLLPSQNTYMNFKIPVFVCFAKQQAMSKLDTSYLRGLLESFQRRGKLMKR